MAANGVRMFPDYLKSDSRRPLTEYLTLLTICTRSRLIWAAADGLADTRITQEQTKLDPAICNMTLSIFEGKVTAGFLYWLHSHHYLSKSLLTTENKSALVLFLISRFQVQVLVVPLQNQMLICFFDARNFCFCLAEVELRKNGEVLLTVSQA